MDKNLRDALLKLTTIMPVDNTAVTSGAIDTGKSTAMGRQLASVEYLLTAPALATGELADAATMTYDVIHSDNADLSAPATLYPGVIVQTGAGGAGALINTHRCCLPTDAKRYIGFKATPSGNADASAKSALLEVLA